MDEVTVYRSWDEPMADMAVGLLRAEGLNARKLTDVVKSIYPFTFDGLGEIEVRVPGEEAEKAAEILSARFSDQSIPSPNRKASED